MSVTDQNGQVDMTTTGDLDGEFACPDSEGIQRLVAFERWVRFVEWMEEHAEDDEDEE